MVAQAQLHDAALDARVTSLLETLTLEEKVGQIIQADVGSVTAEDVRRYRLGAVLSGGNSSPNGDDLAPAQVWLAAADALYEASMDTSGGKHAIPVMWGVDAVHGHNNIIGATLFPQNVGLGATRNPDLIRRIGEVTARELRTTGQEWTFAPTLAVAQDVRWGRAYESYSQDPTLVAEYAAAIFSGLQGAPGSADFLRDQHVIATAKHFLGDGGTFEGRDQGDARVTEEQLISIHAAGYPPAIAAGAQAVMASFSSWHGVKIHGHKGLLTDALKGRLGFKGFIVGDWDAHGQIPGCSKTSCAAAVNAGLDMFMAPESWKELYEHTVSQVRSGEIAIARVDDAVRRILKVKARAGLFEAGKPSSRPLAGQFKVLGAPEHRAVARQAVRESLVLLKNSRAILPLKPGSNVLVAGDGADSLPKQNGGWTLSWQGTGTTNAHFPNGETIFAGIRKTVEEAGGVATLSPRAEYATKPDVAIVVYGEDPYAEFQGDIETLDYKPGSTADLELLTRLRAARIPVVSIFISGRPLWVNAHLNASDAFVAAWLPGSEGGGVADVLFADRDGRVRHDFKGRLSFDWPRTSLPSAGEQPLFPFGFGLRYADDGELAPLSEARSPQAETARRTYFAGGKLRSGFELATGEADSRSVLSGAVGVSRDGSLKVTVVDAQTQEAGRLASWSDGARATLALQTMTPIDLQREANSQLALSFDYRVDAAPRGEVQLALECGAECRAALPIQRQLEQGPMGEWRTLRLRLRCFEERGADLRKVTAPFAISATGPLQLAFANVRIEAAGDVTTCN